MLLDKAAMLSLIGAAFTGVLTTANTIQANFYSDYNCTLYVSSINFTVAPKACEPLPPGANSLLIASCTDPVASCDYVTPFSTGNVNNCSINNTPPDIGAIQCPCGKNPNPSLQCLSLNSTFGIPEYVGIVPYSSSCVPISNLPSIVK